MSILQLYNDKTKLKGVKGQEDFYTKGKQLLNSIYGMMVTSIIMPVHTYGPNGWTIEEKEAEIVDIKFAVSASVYAEEQIYCFSAMIIYN